MASDNQARDCRGYPNAQYVEFGFVQVEGKTYLRGHIDGMSDENELWLVDQSLYDAIYYALGDW